MAKITAEDIVIWLFIAATLTIIIWKMFGSPSDLAVVIALGLFIIGLISILTKKVYKIENKTSLGFMNVKNYINNLRKDFNHNLNKIDNRLANIESLIQKIK